MSALYKSPLPTFKLGKPSAKGLESHEAGPEAFEDLTVTNACSGLLSLFTIQSVGERFFTRAVFSHVTF